MSLVRIAVYWTMDYACNWTGHRIFRCYNGPGWVNRVWLWANDIEEQG